ncbi:MAG: hypothetical protein ACRBBN_14245 [Methyloligellaceae bacterium]
MLRKNGQIFREDLQSCFQLTVTHLFTLFQNLKISLIIVLFAATLQITILPVNQTFSQEAAKGRVTAVKGEGFGRMMFSLDRLPKYTYDLAGTILVIKFKERVNVNVGLVPEKLDSYISVARRDPDGLALRFALTGTFRVRITDVGANLFVDILPSSWVGMPPTLPKKVLQELSRAAEEAALKAKEEAIQLEEARDKNKVKVRVALHPTFGRIVFDWNVFSTVRMARDGRRITIRFGKLAKIDLSQLKVDPPPYLSKIALIDNPRGLEVELVVHPEAKVRGFREGNDFVVDLSGPDASVDLSARDARKKIADKFKLQNLKDDKDPKNAKLSPQELDASGYKNDVQNKDAVKNKGAKVFEVPIKVRSVAFDPEHLERKEFGDLDTNFETDDEGFNYYQVWRGVQKEKKKKKAKSGKGEKDKVVIGPDGQKKKVKEASGAEVEPANDQTITAVSKVQDNRMEILFPFKQPVATAIFQRGKTISLVLDTTKEINLTKVVSTSGGMIESISRDNSAEVLVVRVKLAKQWISYARRDEDGWKIIVGDMVRGDLKTLHAKRSLRPDKRPIMVIPYRKPGHVYWIKDPELKDDLVVVTGFSPTRGFVKSQKFVEHHILESAHGIVLKPLSEDVSVRLRVDEVIISRKEGLSISSSNVYNQLSRIKPRTTNHDSMTGFIDFTNWRKGGDKFFISRVGVLERAITALPPASRSRKRIELARLYIANHLAPEALGVVKQVVTNKPTADNDPAINILRGAANVMLGRNKDAREDLGNHSLAFDKNAALWRGYLAVNEKKWPAALKQFTEGKTQIPKYPPEMQARFRLLEAKAALAVKQLRRAADSLDAMPTGALPKKLKAEADLLRGRYFELIGMKDQALSAFKRVVKTDTGVLSAEAELRKINMLLKNKTINSKQAIKALERLSIIWRGDENELHTLHRLAELYANNKEYRSAFQIMKNTVIAFPSAKEALQIQDEMKEVFTDLFLYGKADSMSPIKALGLFYDYKELTPIGRLGDELIRRLAGRLIQVELLDQASELFDYQIKNRLNGIARAQVAARLAMVHLMNRKPALALRTIRDTRQPDLPSSLKRRRDILEARALGEMGRVENTIDILSQLKGYEIARLRADAYWTAQRWQSAGELIEEMLGTRWQDERPLDSTERFDVLRGAISYSLSEDQFALDRLRKKYYKKMLKGPDAEAFILVTSPISKRGDDFNKLAKEISSIDTLDAFIKEFRARFDIIDGKASSKIPEGKGKS